MMNMGEIGEYGIRADERQQLEDHRAGYQAFRIMTGVGIIAMVVAVLVLRQEAVAAGIAIVVMTGLGVYEYQLQKTGWEEYVQEQVASNKNVRRRALRSIIIRGAIVSTFWVLYGILVDDRIVGKSLLYGIVQGIVITIAYWWYEVHVAVRKNRRRHREEAQA